MWIFCLIVVGDAISNLLCCLAFSIVEFLWMFHFSEGTRWMPRYVYGSFCVKVGKRLFLKWIVGLVCRPSKNNSWILGVQREFESPCATF